MIREAIKQELKNRGWTIEKLSKESGIRYQTLTEFLNGNKGLFIKHLETVFETLDLRIFHKL